MDPFKNLLFFYDSIDSKTSTRNKEKCLIGVHWMEGCLQEEEFQKKVKKPNDQDKEIELGTLKPINNQEKEQNMPFNENDDHGEEDNENLDHEQDDDAQIYYNSREPLNQFIDQVSVKKDLQDFIAGSNTTPAPKPRRRKKSTGSHYILKKERYEQNTRCQLCEEPADLKKSGTFQTRCNCYLEKKNNGQIPPALRFHMRCLKKQKISDIVCESCKKEIPCEDEKTDKQLFNKLQYIKAQPVERSKNKDKKKVDLMVLEKSGTDTEKSADSSSERKQKKRQKSRDRSQEKKKTKKPEKDSKYKSKRDTKASKSESSRVEDRGKREVNKWKDKSRSRSNSSLESETKKRRKRSSSSTPEKICDNAKNKRKTQKRSRSRSSSKERRRNPKEKDNKKRFPKRMRRKLKTKKSEDSSDSDSSNDNANNDSDSSRVD